MIAAGPTHDAAPSPGWERGSNALEPFLNDGT
jgi:hypothetical protein